MVWVEDEAKPQALLGILLALKGSAVVFVNTKVGATTSPQVIFQDAARVVEEKVRSWRFRCFSPLGFGRRLPILVWALDAQFISIPKDVCINVLAIGRFSTDSHPAPLLLLSRAIPMGMIFLASRVAASPSLPSDPSSSAVKCF